MRRTLLSTAAACALLTACGGDAPPATTAAPAPVEAAAPAAHVFEPAITAADATELVKVLASDDFAGRAPGTPGETRTVEYIRDQFQRIGLEPGNGDSWYQTVPMVITQADTSVTLDIAKGDTHEVIPFGADMVVGTSTGQAEVAVNDSAMVFVGYGVNAPERGWNDYAGVDVRGKTVVMFINDPGFHSGDESLFDGRAMTYYGRWTYKYEEAARQGAAAALIIHDDAGAAYGWGVVQNGATGPQFDLPAESDPSPRLPVHGWISGPTAQRVLALAGHDVEALRVAAGKPGFKAIELPTTLSTTLRSTITRGESRNVLGLLRGSTRPDEAVVYMAHWDHLGENPALDGDHVFNGAVDNATGVAGILEIAGAFAAQTPKPERSVLFLAVTLEESGLLGSAHYVANPVFPMARTAAVVNLDAHQPIGRTRDMVVVGMGNSQLEDILRDVAAGQNRAIHGEAATEKGFFFRSDHFNFVKAGVPSLYAKGGNDHVEKGEVHGQAIADAYIAQHYHKPSDAWDPSWDLSGMVEDFEALYQVGRTIAGSSVWPEWYEGNAFRATREASLAAAKAEAEAAAPAAE